MTDELPARSYFHRGIPPWSLFMQSLTDLAMLIRSPLEPEDGPSTLRKLCLVGLVAYVEAFFKNEFAALINLYPDLLMAFSEKRGEVTLNVLDLINPHEDIQNKIGFLVSEKYDFGTARSINGLYKDLIGITPFSESEMKKYDRLLNDRNLLVHHGGIFTPKYRGRHV